MDAVCKIAKYFGMTIDDLINFDGNMPDEVIIEDQSLINQKYLKRKNGKKESLSFGGYGQKAREWSGLRRGRPVGFRSS